jgi:hypothetical protein
MMFEPIVAEVGDGASVISAEETISDVAVGAWLKLDLVMLRGTSMALEDGNSSTDELAAADELAMEVTSANVKEVTRSEVTSCDDVGRGSVEVLDGCCSLA